MHQSCITVKTTKFAIRRPETAGTPLPFSNQFSCPEQQHGEFRGWTLVGNYHPGTFLLIVLHAIIGYNI
jgi:hypothetical protein